MKMNLFSRFAAMSVLAIMIAAPVVASAQDQGGVDPNKKVTLNLENAEIRFALKLLFQNAGANFVLEQSVQGTVTASLTDVPFSVALSTVLKSVSGSAPLTYRIESGVYTIVPKVERDETNKNEPEEKDKPTETNRYQRLSLLRTIDSATLAEMLGFTTIQAFPLGASMGFGGGFGGGMGGGMMGGMGGGMGGMGGGMMGGMGGGMMGGMGGGMMGGMGGGMGGGGFGGGGFGGGGMGGFGGGIR